MTQFPRIPKNPKVMLGKACIRGKRIMVEVVLGHLADGVSLEELLNDYPNLEREDILEAVRYGAWVVSGRRVELAEQDLQ